MWVHLIKEYRILESANSDSPGSVRDKQNQHLPAQDLHSILQITSLRILLTLATMKNVRIFAWDMESAYLPWQEYIMTSIWNFPMAMRSWGKWEN